MLRVAILLFVHKEYDLGQIILDYKGLASQDMPVFSLHIGVLKLVSNNKVQRHLYRLQCVQLR